MADASIGSIVLALSILVMTGPGGSADGDDNTTLGEEGFSVAIGWAGCARLAFGLFVACAR
jgi:hypothetical protein